jgi:hypothetical protein
MKFCDCYLNCKNTVHRFEIVNWFFFPLVIDFFLKTNWDLYNINRSRSEHFLPYSCIVQVDARVPVVKELCSTVTVTKIGLRRNVTGIRGMVHV